MVIFSAKSPGLKRLVKPFKLRDRLNAEQAHLPRARPSVRVMYNPVVFFNNRSRNIEL
jgi:hypothetical protein